MKTLLKIVFIVAVVAFCNSVYAQKPLKLAHINSQELIQSMPEYDTALLKLQKMEKELTTELELIQVEFNRKLEEFQKNGPNLTELVKQSREQELVTMNQKLQTFRESAMESLQQENAKLMQPISEKANKAIENVAKEQGITYVLDAQAVHFKSVDSIDLLPQVQLHLGIKKK